MAELPADVTSVPKVEYDSDEDPEILQYSPYHGPRKRIPPEIIRRIEVNLVPPSDAIQAERVFSDAPSSCYAHYFTMNPGPEVLYCIGYLRSHYLNARKAGRHPEFYSKLETFLTHNFSLPRGPEKLKCYLQMVQFRLSTNRCLSAHESEITPPFFLMGDLFNEIAECLEWRSNDTVWRELARFNHPHKVQEVLADCQTDLQRLGFNGRRAIRKSEKDGQTINEWRGAATTFVLDCEDLRQDIDAAFAAFSGPIDCSSGLVLQRSDVLEVLERWEGLQSDNYISLGRYHDDVEDDWELDYF